MSGYYPPGVTGNEPQIAGSVDLVVEKQCGSDGIDVYPKLLVDELIGNVSQVLTSRRTVRQEGDGLREETNKERLLRAQNELLRMREELDRAGMTTDDACTFDGEVDAQVWNFTLTWTCPWCGAEHEDDRHFERDPDEGRDE